MKRLRSLAAAIAFALCVLLAAAAPALAATGSISGTVTDASTHSGISGISVCANGVMFGPFGACAGTDSGGSYTIENLEPGIYAIAFEEEGRQNYLAQWFPDKAKRSEASTVQVESGQALTGRNAELAPGGEFEGTVTDLADGSPVEGVEVCAEPVAGFPDEPSVMHCGKSKAAGKYLVQALATDSYRVRFSVYRTPNYVTQFYPGKATSTEAEAVSITAGAPPRAGIDAAMQEGVDITGHVSEVGGGPIGQTGICALNPLTEAVVNCDGAFGPEGGNYSIAGLPLGQYVVAFAVDSEEDGVVLHPDGYVRQYYDGKPTFGEATLVGGGPGVYSGIDAQLVKGDEVFPSRRPPAISPPSFSYPPIAQAPRVHPKRCRKGFQRKRVKGAVRCVRKRPKHRPRAHGARRG